MLCKPILIPENLGKGGNAKKKPAFVLRLHAILNQEKFSITTIKNCCR